MTHETICQALYVQAKGELRREVATPMVISEQPIVRDALVTKIGTLPAALKQTLTWDHGSEMHFHGQFTQATNMPVYFCDSHSPWQRGSNENTT